MLSQAIFAKKDLWLQHTGGRSGMIPQINCFNDQNWKNSPKAKIKKHLRKKNLQTLQKVKKSQKYIPKVKGCKGKNDKKKLKEKNLQPSQKSKKYIWKVWGNAKEKISTWKNHKKSKKKTKVKIDWKIIKEKTSKYYQNKKCYLKMYEKYRAMHKKKQFEKNHEKS